MANRFLNRVFLADAATCFACFALLVTAADTLAPVLGLGAGILRGAGWLLLPVAALFGWIATRKSPPMPMVLLGIVGNFAWVVASVAVIMLMQPTPIGVAFVAAQAAAVLLLAVLEYRGFRQAIAAA